MNPLAIQDQLYPQGACFGCGPASPDGLRLKSYVTDSGVVATFLSRPEHDNGAGFLNGGIIATVLDCHSGAAVLHTAVLNGWTRSLADPMPYVTAEIDVRFVRPAPLNCAVDLHAEIQQFTESEVMCWVELRHEEKLRATGQATWKRWRPRS